LVAFLEKPFEFTTNLSMDECVARLKAKSKRGTGFFASRRDILVTISDEIDGKIFKLDRDWGRNLYAEVHGQLKRNVDGSTQVTGFGKVRLFILVFGVIYTFTALGIAYGFREVTEFALFWSFMAMMPWIFLLVTFRNRASLIKLVKQTLEANE
jgi:hypothetical protein